MSPPAPLLLLLLALNAAHGLAWWLGVRWLGVPARDAQRGTRHGLLGSAVLALAWGLSGGSTTASGAVAAWLLVLATMLARRGQAVLLHRGTRDGEQACLLWGVGLAAWILGPGAPADWLRGVLVALAMGWSLLRMGSEHVEAVGRLFGSRHGWLLGAPGLMLGAACWFQAVSAVALPLPAAEQPGAVPLLSVCALLSLVGCQGAVLYLVALRGVRRLRRAPQPLPDLVLN